MVARAIAVLQRKGLWYEAEKGRWRVKLSKKGALYTRAYFADYEQALAHWKRCKTEIAQPEPAGRPLREASLANQFLCR